MIPINYDIIQFGWNGEERRFSAYGWDLYAHLSDGSMHPEAFPSMKGEFFIRNYKTDGFRRFRFIKEDTTMVDENGAGYPFWLFRSEDGIECRIFI